MAFPLPFPLTPAFLARALALAAFVLSLFTSAYASAQTNTVTVSSVYQRRNDRPTGLKQEQINYADCIANETIEFGIAFSGPATSATIQIWVATTAADCTSATDRSNALCWQVWSGPTSARNAFVRVQDLIPGTGRGTAEVCRNATNDKLTLYFMVFPGMNTPEANPGKISLDYDVSGPAAPKLTSLQAGEGRLIANWDAPEDTTITGYRVYCEPAGEATMTLAAGLGGDSGIGGTAGNSGTGGTATSGASADPGGTAGTGGIAGTVGVAGTGGGAGTGDTGGASGGGAAPTAGASGSAGSTSNPSCPSPTLRSGQPPPIELSPRGETANTSNQVAAGGLRNFTTYACAVGAIDTLQNVGPVSEILCGIPEPVVDYFEAYRAAGGQAGGGFCAFGHKPASVAAALFGLAGVAVALRRRARRGASR